jgi:DNA-directed RNA polymerase subunit N (RpoN/RPB10)
MLIPRCPTCKTRLADKQIPFTLMMADICNENSSTEAIDKKKMELLDKLEVIRYCCRMRILTFINLPDLLI